MNSNLARLVAAATSFVLTMAAVVALSESPAVAAQSSDPGSSNQLPSAVPSAITPAVNDGRVFAVAENGSNMIIGGSFTQVGGQSHPSVAVFDKTTGALSSSFAPTVNGDVNTVLPGPTPTTIYIGGAFTQVNGTAAQFIAELDTTNGALVSSFKPPSFNYGFVNDMIQRGNRLYVAGTFTYSGGKAHAGLVSLNATTGALDPFMNIQLTGHHNDSGSGAQGWVGPADLDATPDGKTMVVVGNFKYANGVLRDQVALIDLSGSSAQLDPWSTTRYQPYCYNWAFDTYVRGVSMSPDGSYFIINATGGGNAGTLCDSTARFETDPNTVNAQPTWVDQTGGDTVWGVAVTNSAIYIGGHNRWNNNPDGVDQAKAGAVPRPGLAALDPETGRPFAWNPGRVPLGVSVFAIYASASGLWIGSDTDYIGNYRYKRPKLAFFPYAGGASPASTATPSLPGTVYLGGSKGTGATNVLYRVDAGGPAIQSLDNGPNWAGDTSDPSPYRNNGSNTASYSSGAAISGTVPATTPSAIFDTERWSPSDNPAMQWSFPVTAGIPLQVRLYFANRYTGTSQPGQRVFNVAIDGATVLNHYDIVAGAGDQTGTMKAFNITSDGTVNINFSHVTENPLVDGIEIVRTDQPGTQPTGTNGLTTVAFDGTHASASNADNQGIDFGSWRGALLIGNKVFYGYTDGYVYSRTFNGTTFGPAVKIDPYNDPYWSSIQSGDGTTFQGMVPSLYGQIPNITGMAYSGGRLFYTLFGDSHLYWRWFNPDAGIIDENTTTASSSVSFSSADGMFISGGTLYYGSSGDGDLRSVAMSADGTVSGSPTVVSGPGVDGVNWTNRAMFLSSATNAAPTAAFTSSCPNLTCNFNATGSVDADGTIASYAWNFGDGTTGTGSKPTHRFTSAGSYTVTLTVTDNDGATGSVAHVIAVQKANVKPTAAFTASCRGLTCSFDGSASKDSDGSVVGYAWTFGDGATGSGVTPTHTYSGAGNDTVTLTVTDDRGGTSTTSQVVTPSSGGIQFVGAANAGGGNSKSKQVTVPSAARAGDVALLFLTRTSTATWSGPSGVTGWTQVGSYTNSTLVTTVWEKTVAAGDAGSAVQFSSSAASHASADIAVYTGVDTASPIVRTAQASDVAKASHSTPAITANAGDWVVSFWGDRSAAPVTWTVPSSVALRDASTDTGTTLTAQAVIADSNGAVGGGTYPKITATTNANTGKTAMWTIELDAS